MGQDSESDLQKIIGANTAMFDSLTAFSCLKLLLNKKTLENQLERDQKCD